MKKTPNIPINIDWGNGVDYTAEMIVRAIMEQGLLALNLEHVTIRMSKEKKVSGDVSNEPKSPRD